MQDGGIDKALLDVQEGGNIQSSKVGRAEGASKSPYSRLNKGVENPHSQPVTYHHDTAGDTLREPFASTLSELFEGDSQIPSTLLHPLPGEHRRRGGSVPELRSYLNSSGKSLRIRQHQQGSSDNSGGTFSSGSSDAGESGTGLAVETYTISLFTSDRPSKDDAELEANDHAVALVDGIQSRKAVACSSTGEVVERGEMRLFKKCLGSGSFGKVYVAEFGEQLVAVKILRSVIDAKGDVEETSMAKEVRMGKGLQHPHVLRLLGSIHIGGASVGLMMELMGGGTLEEVIAAYTSAFPSQEGSVTKGQPLLQSTLSNEQLRVFCRLLDLCVQMCSGLGFLHSNHIIHRDLKPNNCLLTADWSVVKLGDFGLSARAENMEQLGSQSCWGNLAYVAPEVLLDNKGNSLMDVWSLGIVMWELLSGASLGYLSKKERWRFIVKRAARGAGQMESERLPCSSFFSSELVDLLEGCWCTQVDLRPQSADIEQRLQTVRKALRRQMKPAGEVRVGIQGTPDDPDEEGNCEAPSLKQLLQAEYDSLSKGPNGGMSSASAWGSSRSSSNFGSSSTIAGGSI
jgi:serine/threonine protein kinase